MIQDILPNTGYITTTATTSINKAFLSESRLNFYPNPFQISTSAVLSEEIKNSDQKKFKTDSFCAFTTVLLNSPF